MRATLRTADAEFRITAIAAALGDMQDRYGNERGRRICARALLDAGADMDRVAALVDLPRATVLDILANMQRGL